MIEEDVELAALRRRAYGPYADIADDPSAQARLAELESRHGAVEAADVELLPDDAAPPPVASAPVGETPVEARRSRRPAWHTAMVVAVAAVALLLGTAAAVRTVGPPVAASADPTTSADQGAAFAFESDPRSQILLRIPLDGAHGHLLDLPSPEAGPRFPTREPLQWSQPLGEYYGWRLWIARDQADRGCILIVAVTSLSRCASAADQASGALFVSVPYAAVLDDERPAELASDQSIGFWWVPGDTVIILTGRTSDASADPGVTSEPPAPAVAGRVVMQVPVDLSISRDATGVSAPAFPLYEPPLWSEPIGTYYGWMLWLARSRDGMLCVLVHRDADSHSRCLAEERFARSELHIAVPYGEVPGDDVPAGMAAGDSLDFQWRPAEGISIAVLAAVD